MSAPFHFVFFLRSFLIGEACYHYTRLKTLNISAIFINYQQHALAVHINYHSRPSKTLGSESEIMWGMAKFGKRTQKSEEAVHCRLSSSVPSGLGFFHVHSPPSHSLEQASKTLIKVAMSHSTWKMYHFINSDNFDATDLRF